MRPVSVVADGATGSILQGSPLSLADFDGHDGCNGVLNVTRPDVVAGVHEVMRLLAPGRIGVARSEEFQLAPEQPTDALIVHHPEAKYFSA